MTRTTLLEYVSKNGQVKTAELLGVTQSAICKALKYKREIYIEEKDGRVTSYEVKKFPSD
nr:MAG TPA: Cro [Caudoviricetes sp.]